MKNYCLFLLLLIGFTAFSQNITVDSQTYSPQQLVEDVLIDSDCISNVDVTNVVGGNFNNTEQSYGYFDATGTNFPFQNGIVLSTGRLSNVPGPNNSLSDDDANGWLGDNDLEIALNESNTLNATILEFDFTAVSDQISFRYLFASEEYQEGNANTCQYSDLFGFLIRPISEQQYTNIALVPNTQTPVKVTTVHSGIPGSCEPINEEYFGSWNGTNVPINFNGQTTVLTAVANTVPNETYHVKLVIADEQNYRYDSAVFLEAGSFDLNIDLGEDRLLATNNPLCEDETITLNASQTNAQGYKWFIDGVEQTTDYCTDCATLEVQQAATYSVEVLLPNSCIAIGEIEIEYTTNPLVQNTTLITCDNDEDGLSIFNLFTAEADVTNNDSTLSIDNFFFTLNEAETNTNAIDNPSAFENTTPFQTVFARVSNQYGCIAIAEVTLETATNDLNIPDFESCDDAIVDGFTTFNLNELQTEIATLVPANATISFYLTVADSFLNTNALSGNYENTIINSETIFVKILTENGNCFALTTVTLKVKDTPVLLEDETFLYCLNSFPETLTLEGGVTNDIPNNFYYQWQKDGVDTDLNTSYIEVNEIGVYTVTVTDPNGCSASRTLTVNPSNIATIDDIIVTQGGFSNNTITVLTSGEGDYLYKLDDRPYQESNIFNNVIAGFHTVSIIDIKNDCGIVEQNISVLGIPSYFTPNGDNVHDTWRPVGLTETNSTIEKIAIFNRYGKILAQFNPVNKAWNGTSNGRNLPSDDYWYIIYFKDGKQTTGHFALVR